MSTYKCVLFSMASLLIMLSGCAFSPNGNSVPFSVISKGVFLRDTRLMDMSSRLFIISSDADVQALAQDEQFAADPDADQPIKFALDTLSNIDYHNSLAIIILLGMDGSKGEDFSTKSIYQQDNQLNIYISAITSEKWYDSLFGGRVSSHFITDPYEIITISKSDVTLANASITVTLLLDNKPVDEWKTLIP